MTYLEHLYFFEGQPQKPSGLINHCPWLGVLKCGWMGLARCFDGVLENTPSCRVRDHQLQSNKEQFGGEWKKLFRAFLASQTPF